MVETHYTVTIRRPIAEVFAFLANPMNDSRWRPAVKEISVQGPVAVGTVVRQVVAGPMGDEDADYRFTAYDVDARFAFETVSGKVRPTGEYRFREVDGGTEVAVSMSAGVPLMLKMFGSVIQKEMDKDAAALERAREILEAD